MPIHEYKCQSCGAKTEVLQKLKDKPLQKCPKCGGPVRKLISSPAIQFKGSGFYITDYAHKNIPGQEKHGRDEKPAEKTAAKPESKPESKPEAKAEGASAKKPAGAPAD